jgi:hypothetical protein
MVIKRNSPDVAMTSRVPTIIRRPTVPPLRTPDDVLVSVPADVEGEVPDENARQELDPGTFAFPRHRYECPDVRIRQRSGPARSPLA